MSRLRRRRCGKIVAAAAAALACSGLLAAQPAGPAADADRIAAAQAELGFRLVERVKDKERPNVAVSPASLAGVFAFIDLIADAKLREGLIKSLGLESAGGETALATLREAAKRLSVPQPVGSPLAFANAMFVDPELRPLAGGLEKLREAGGEALVLKLTDNDGIARVNGWVSERTRGLIPSILYRPLERAGLVALNALYFNDRWKTAFDPKNTRPAPFRPVAGDAVEVAMMHLGDQRLRFRQDEGFVAVDLPYTSERFSLVIVTSKDKPLDVAGFAPVAGWMAGRDFKELPGDVALPKFAMSASAELLDALDAMGLMPGRMSDTAFEGLTPVPTDIVQILQRTVIRMDESGTEAAAATAVIGLARAARPEPADRVRMVVDKPFLFALRERDSGLILLAGYVGRPEAP
jgi:serpin B